LPTAAESSLKRQRRSAAAPQNNKRNPVLKFSLKLVLKINPVHSLNPNPVHSLVPMTRSVQDVRQRGHVSDKPKKLKDLKQRLAPKQRLKRERKRQRIALHAIKRRQKKGKSAQSLHKKVRKGLKSSEKNIRAYSAMRLHILPSSSV
jgi:hypothetical protein